MAETIVRTTTSDISGQPAETTSVISLDNVRVQIDLTADERLALVGALQPYLGAGRPVRDIGRRANRSRSERRDLGAVRTWARENGHQVNERGRVPGEILAAYEAAHR